VELPDLEEKVPAMQSMQLDRDVDPCDVEYVPGEQVLHSVVALVTTKFTIKVPGLQNVHRVLPILFENDPFEHDLQASAETAPNPDKYVPSQQDVQLSEKTIPEPV
jgi:hypothetical protein